MSDDSTPGETAPARGTTPAPDRGVMSHGGGAPDTSSDPSAGGAPDARDAPDARATAQAADTTAPQASGQDGTARRGVLARLRQGPGAGVAVVLGAAGLLFVASGSTAQGTDLRTDSSDLAGLVRQERDRAEHSTAVVDDLRSEVEQLARAAGDGVPPGIEAQVSATGEAAGMQAVTGPAVRVVLDDADFSSRRAARAQSPDDLVVHQQDIQAVVNALWAGGAEAMMLMDQRVISTSAVRCIGNTLSLQGQPYSPPYVVTAIGDPDTMLASLAASDDVATYQQYVEAYGLGYDVDAVGDVELPAYSGPLELRFAVAGT